VSKVDKDTLTDLKHKKFGEPKVEEEKKEKKEKNKKGGPNPLSCKKKKKKSTTQNETVTSNKKKRKRLKVPKHVREHWTSLVKEELTNK
jgi:U3 small nucleolar RNA-associated protein 23